MHEVGVFVVVVPGNDLGPVGIVADDAFPDAAVAVQTLHVADVRTVVVDGNSGHIELVGADGGPAEVGVDVDQAPGRVVAGEMPDPVDVRFLAEAQSVFHALGHLEPADAGKRDEKSFLPSALSFVSGES